MGRGGRRFKKGRFGWVLIGSIVLMALGFKELYELLPVHWGWILSVKRRGAGTYNSALGMFSLIAGILGGLTVTDRLHRGREVKLSWGLLLIPTLATAMAIGVIRVAELQGAAWAQRGNDTALMGLWWLSLLLIWGVRRLLGRTKARWSASVSD